MSEPLTVHSHFEDIAQMAEGLADRVDDGRFILYGPTNYEQGERIAFSVLLLDGTPVIEGLAVVAASIDGGEERDPSIRYDVVLSNLELDDRSEIMFERIMMVAMGGDDADRSTSTELGEEEAAPEAAEAAEAAAEVAEAEAPADEYDEPADDMDAEAAAASDPEEGAEAAADADEDVPVDADGDEELAAAAAEGGEGAADSSDEAEEGAEGEYSPAVEPEGYSVTEGEFVGDAPESEDEASAYEADDGLGSDDGFGDDLGHSDPFEEPRANKPADGVVVVEGALPPPEPPPPPAPFNVARLAEVGLSRPVHGATWWPEAAARPEPSPSTGAFIYEGALPIPTLPPRPQLDPSLRVAPAPHPAGAQTEMAEEPAAAPAEYYEEAEAVDPHGETQYAEDEGAYEGEEAGLDEDYG